MSQRMSSLLVATLFSLAALSVDGLETNSKMSTAETVRMLLQVEEREHVKSLARITETMTVTSALQVLQKKSWAAPELVTLVQEALRQGHKAKTQADGMSANLRAGGGSTPATGYSGVDKAKKMLNEMIEEVQSKYDLELQTCCNYDESQSAIIEETRQDISMYNAIAAEARGEVLEASDQIHICETKLPELSDALSSHNKECKEEIAALEAQLAIVMADISVMDTILGMTKCDKSLFLLRCEDACTGASFVSFGHEGMHKAAMGLKSTGVRDLLTDSLAEAYGDDSENATLNFTTTWAPVTIPEMTLTRTGPCKAPVAEDKRTGKCSMNSNPNCPKMQEKFKYIQSGIEDKRDELQEQLAKLKKDCETVRLNLEAQISDFESKLKEAQVALAAGTKKINNAEAQSRLKNTELKVLLADYARMTKTCHTNYETYEGEECGLKKIRGELYKMQGQNNPAFFQDCVVSGWLPGECSATCAGGVMKLTRSIVTKPVGGASCPLLEAQKPCNEHKCPIDCKVHDWEGWSGCSSKCGGGLKERNRGVDVEPMHGGEPCGETSEAISCNLQACDKNCVLSDWGGWSECSKECDAGVTERTKTILEPVVGDGTCDAIRSDERHQQSTCNAFQCKRAVGQPTLRCKSKLDVILVIDGSGSLGQQGWDASVKAGAMLARAFGGGTGGTSDVKIAVLLYSYYSKWIQHFSSDCAGAATKIENMAWPRSMTFTANALLTARSELSLGRDDAQSIIILITDGRPMSMRRTAWASYWLRRDARLMVVPVTRWAPVAEAKSWASYPKEDNFLPLPSFSDLDNPDKIDLIIADACPDVY